MNTPANEVKHGDWLFTCLMEPVQFGDWWSSDQDMFQTIDGSNHSQRNCGLILISETYAKWFIGNRMWQWFDLFKSDRFAENAPWRIVQLYNPHNGISLYRRTSIGGCEYTYTKKNGAYTLHVFSHGSFIYYPPTDKPFDLHRSAWIVYEAYVKHRAEQDGLVYEGI